MNEYYLYVVLPCYNEEENIGHLICEWEKHLDKLYERSLFLKLIIINDGSKDKTPEIVKALQGSYDNITLLNHEINSGLGEAINTGINYVLGMRTKGLVCIMDSDFTHQPEYIYSLLESLQTRELDCVIASRYQKGSRVEGLSYIRKFLSYGARVVYSSLLKIPGVKDYTCGYRLYRMDALRKLYEKYNGSIIKERGFACMMELLYKLYLEGFKIGEVPFVLKYQLKGGKSKMKVFITIYRSLATIKNLKRKNMVG